VDRKLAAEAQAVDTNWAVARPDCEGRDVGVAHEFVIHGRHRVLPQLRFGDPRPEEAADRPHVAMQQLVPGLGEGQRELVDVRQEAPRDL
jgi:hypothetical protein